MEKISKAQKELMLGHIDEQIAVNGRIITAYFGWGGAHYLEASEAQCVCDKLATRRSEIEAMECFD